MGFQKDVANTGDALLKRFDDYHAKLDKERRDRREQRRKYVLVMDRTMALMIDFAIVILLFSGTLMSGGDGTMMFAAILTKLVQDPSFTSQQALRVLHETGILRVFIASSMAQLFALAVIIVPSLRLLQATPGMYVLGIRVRCEDRVSKPGLLRCIGFFFSGMLLLAPFMITYLGVLLRKDRRAWHDVMSGVVLLRRKVIEQEKQDAVMREAEEAAAASTGTAAE